MPVSFKDTTSRITNPIQARDLLMLLCQDEVRNSLRQSNAEKKLHGEEVKLGRRKSASNDDNAHQSKEPSSILPSAPEEPLIVSPPAQAQAYIVTSTPPAQIQLAHPTTPTPPALLNKPTPRPPTPPASRASYQDRKASLALRQSINSQKKLGHIDLELTAVIRNCDVIEQKADDPELQKKCRKKVQPKPTMDKDFFKGLGKTRSINIRRTSIFFYSNCQEPLAAIINNAPVIINAANI